MIDWKALWGLVDHKRHCERLSFRELAIEIGVSPSLFTRMKDGRATDADSFVKLLNWLKISHRSLETK